MSDLTKEICDKKKRDVLRVFKSSGPTTNEERDLTIKAATAIVDVLSASALKLIEYGVPEDPAYIMIFGSINDKVLLNMTRWLWGALRPKMPHETK